MENITATQWWVKLREQHVGHSINPQTNTSSFRKLRLSKSLVHTQTWKLVYLDVILINLPVFVHHGLVSSVSSSVWCWQGEDLLPCAPCQLSSPHPIPTLLPHIGIDSKRGDMMKGEGRVNSGSRSNYNAQLTATPSVPGRTPPPLSSVTALGSLPWVCGFMVSHGFSG